MINKTEKVLMMYEARKKVLWFAVLVRVSIFILQLMFNTFCPDHNADAFRSPLDLFEQISVYDKIVNLLFGGLTRWDGEYFIHIAKYGYTYENMLAFYPLYPTITRFISILIKKLFYVLNYRSSIIIAAILINFFCFIKSALILYDLSKIVLKSTRLAYKAAIFYCINPASIFFSATYSESMYAYLTFYTILESSKNSLYAFLPLGLSTLVRSNGIINIGFPLYFRLKGIFNAYAIEVFSKKHKSFLQILLNIISKKDFIQHILSIFNTTIITLLTFILLQIYNYVTFCIPGTTSLPSHIISYAKRHQLVLQYSGTSKWCHIKIPVAYSYIQEKYWNVGLFNYYEFKQVPNFLLALPVLYIMVRCIIEYYMEHKKYVYALGFQLEDTKIKRNITVKKYPAEMFVFMVHGFFLTIFCICFVHIQVSTRLLCSASPLVYWYCALSFSDTNPSKSKNESIYEDGENAFSRWKIFLFCCKRYTLKDKFILSYFLGYTIVGCFMFSNFLPWT